MAKSKKVEAAFKEVFHNKPRTVDTSKSKEGQRKQMVAIALSKARQAGAHIPSYDKGGTVKETGLALVHKGEKVVATGNTKLTRAAQVLPNTTFKTGSEGSKMADSNCPCPPSKVTASDVMCGSRGSETQENHFGSRTRDIPKITDHLFQSEAIIDNTPPSNLPEMTRRENSHSRDRRTGFKRTDDKIYADSDS